MVKVAPLQRPDSSTGAGPFSSVSGGGDAISNDNEVDEAADADDSAGEEELLLPPLPSINPHTGKKKIRKNLMDIYAVVRFEGEPAFAGRRTSTIKHAGRNHIVAGADELQKQTIRVPAHVIGSGQATISVFDDDFFSGDDLIGSWTGNLVHILKDDCDLPRSRWKRNDDGSVVFRFDLSHGPNAAKAGKVDVTISRENSEHRDVSDGQDTGAKTAASKAKSRPGALVLTFKKFVALRDVAAITNFHNNIDLAPLFYSSIALFVYYTIGVLFYSQVPRTLRTNTTSIATDYSCSGGTLASTFREVASSSPTDDMLASCDQSLFTASNESAACSGFADAFYFTTATLTTVGYGDMSPKGADPGNVLFAAIFAFVGVAFIGVGLGVIAGFVMDKQAAASQALKESGGSPQKTAVRKRCEKQFACCFSNSGQAICKALAAMIVALVVGMIFYYIELVWGQGIDPTELAQHSEHPESMFVKVLYFATITSTTIGYGDEAPRSIAGRLVGSIYMLFAVTVFGFALSSLADIPLEKRRLKLEEKVTTQYGSSLSPVELTNILRSANPQAVNDAELDSVAKAEFVVAMLLKLNKLKPDQIAMIEEQFHRLDVNRSGSLTIEDVTEITPNFEDMSSSSSDAE